MLGLSLPTYTDVERAALQIAGVAHRTPVITSRSVDRRVGARVFLKCENLQRAGTFKFRGAYNALAALPAAERLSGVVAYSSGNHAQALALAGRLVGTHVVIVMPTDAPAIKRAATAEYGAEIILYDRAHEDREGLGRALASERGLVLIPPFDHPHVIAGQGTAARELFEEVGPLDLLLVPCGGGGLLSGSALAARALAPSCRIVGVEPAAGDDATRSFYSRHLQTVVNPETVADGARTHSLGTLTFTLVLELVDEMTTVTDPQLLRTMFYLWERLKIVVEPTGALGAAALFETDIARESARIGVILSGGNVDFPNVERWRQQC